MWPQEISICGDREHLGENEHGEESEGGKDASSSSKHEPEKQRKVVEVLGATTIAFS